MIHADPWNEISRLQDAMEADLLAELDQARLNASATSFCVEKCRVDCRCPLRGALASRAQCPLWMYVREMPLRS